MSPTSDARTEDFSEEVADVLMHLKPGEVVGIEVSPEDDPKFKFFNLNPEKDLEVVTEPNYKSSELIFT